MEWGEPMAATSLGHLGRALCLSAETNQTLTKRKMIN